ncbi:MAG: ATP-dependent metallopeptidase FtsH/Yme1/Tma family protein, partial [Ruminococcus sp.]
MDNKKKTRNLLIYIGIPIVVILLISMIFNFAPKGKTYYTSELVGYFQKGQVARYELNYGTGAIKITLNDKDKTVISGVVPEPIEFRSDIKEYEDKNKDMEYNLVRAADNSFLMSLLPTIIGIVILVAFWFFIMKKMSAGGLGGKEMNFGKAKIKDTNDEKRKTTFEDVAGADEEKEELEEIVEFLKNPDKFNA